MEVDKELLIEKILYLSERLRDVQFYDILEPWSFKKFDFIELQQAGKKIAEFIGLSDLTFVIAIAKQAENKAGHIELDFNKEVFIEIDSNSHYNDRVLLAIMSHEICHKYLQLHNIKRLGLENEILTDIAAIYLGLGKLLLNGCSSSNHRVGYLDRSQYSFIYKLICSSRRVPEDIMLRNIDPQIATEIKTIQLNDTFNFYSNEDTVNYLNEYLNESSLLHQKTYANLKRNIIIINRIMEELDRQYKSYHNRIFQNKNHWLRRIEKTHKNESTNFFKNLEIINEINLTKQKEEGVNPRNLVELLNEFIYFINKTLKDKKVHIGCDAKHIIECPNCNHPMSLNKEIQAKINCLKCSHSFIINTEPFSATLDRLEKIEMLEKQQKPVYPKKKKGQGFLKRITSIFKK